MCTSSMLTVFLLSASFTTSEEAQPQSAASVLDAGVEAVAPSPQGEGASTPPPTPTQPQPPPEVAPPVLPSPPAPPKPPYSLPWQLRPLAPVRTLRLDNSLALSNDGQSDVLIVNGVWSFHPRLIAIVRLGGVFNAPTTGVAGNSLTNALVGATYLHPLGDFRLGGFFGLTLPIASGGGNTPDPGSRTANAAAVLTRSAMDNALFAANDLILVPGVAAAWIKGGLTVQLEATVLELIRVRGETAQRDALKTNFTSGLHVGYFFTPGFSVGGELRWQRWLSTPVAVADNEGLRQNVNAALGARLHIKTAMFMLRPGVSYSQGLLGPMADRGYRAIQFDLPIVLL